MRLRVGARLAAPDYLRPVVCAGNSKNNLIATNLRLKTVHPSTGSGRTVFSSATGRFSVHGELVEP